MRRGAAAGAVAWVLAGSLALGGCGGAGGPAAELVAPDPAEAPAAASASAPATSGVDPAVASLMDGAGMTPAGRRIFLEARPRVEDRATLARSCAAVLDGGGRGRVHTFGCVVRGRVHVRAFDDAGLAPFASVVAAHELLHLVYGRLGATERARLDAQLAGAREAAPEVGERLEPYGTDAADTANELHSILGTEVGDLPAALEAHFGRWFDRSLVLAAFERSLGWRQREIRQLAAQAAATDARLEEMRQRLDGLRTSGSTAAYNAMIEQYNALVREHNTTVARAQALADEYNRLTGS